MRADKQILIFEHIPKTAGSTLRMILRRVYGGSAVCVINPGETQTYVDDLLAQMNEGQVPKVIVNHAGYGLHDLLPSAYQYRHFVMLREPIERTISYYYYRRQNGKLDASVSLEDHIQNHPRGIWNWQTAFLSGLALKRNFDDTPLTADVFTEGLLQQAKSALRANVAVGLTERFEESILLYRSVFDWSLMRSLYVPRNVGKKRPAHLSLPEKTLKLLWKHNELDLELYDFGNRLFQQQIEERLPELRRNLERYQRLNAVFGKVFPVVFPPAARVVHAFRDLFSRDHT